MSELRHRLGRLALAWSQLELRTEAGGMRQYLDGEPVHCGDALELQHTESRSDEYGEFSVPLQKGTVVRYEATFRSGLVSFSLHTSIGGHEFVAIGEQWLRFRWPKEKR